MKSVKNVYSKMLNKEYIKSVILKAAKGKKKRREVQKVLNNLDLYAGLIQQMLEKGEFEMRPTHTRIIHEKGKDREITVSPFFPNRILDYLMVETLKPYIRKGMYDYCVGNVDKRGIVYGKKAVERQRGKYKYFIKLDIRKFYPSTKSDVLMAYIERRVRDKRFIALCRAVILSEDCMPIGSYYSQWLSNWFLQDLDHFVKQELRVPFYIRYVDDMLLMGNNKRALRRAMYSVRGFLESKGLELKTDSEVIQTALAPVDFLGFRFYADKTLLRLRTFKYLNSVLRHIRRAKHIAVSQARRLVSYIGWLVQSGGRAYYREYIRPFALLGVMRRMISNHDLSKKMPAAA